MYPSNKGIKRKWTKKPKPTSDEDVKKKVDDWKLQLKDAFYDGAPHTNFDANPAIDDRWAISPRVSHT